MGRKEKWEKISTHIVRNKKVYIPVLIILAAYFKGCVIPTPWGNIIFEAGKNPLSRSMSAPAVPDVPAVSQ